MNQVVGEDDLTIALYRGREGLESLRDAWEAVTSGMDRIHYFHLWEWHHSYLECLAPESNGVMFFLFAEGGRPVAILPLQSTTITLGGMKLKALAFPSHDHLPLCDLIRHRDARLLPLFSFFVRYLRNQKESWDLIHLPHLLEDACAIQTVHGHTPPRVLLRDEGRCDFMDTSGRYEPFLAGLSKNFRRSLKRARQHLDELSGVDFAFTQSGPELEGRFEAFLDVEASGWKGAQGAGTAIKLNPRLSSFYRALMGKLASSGKVSINTLSADGKCIAAQFCLLMEETAYILKIGYDEGYKRYAPGNLLVDEFVRRSMQDGTFKEINLITDAEWHEDWKPKSYKKSRLYIFNTTASGLIAFAILKSYPILKRHYDRYLRPCLTRRTAQ